TPQIGVNGSRQVFGSNANAMNAAIVEASRAKSAGSISVDAIREGTKLTATIRAEAPPNSDIVLAVIENDVATHIERGENAGRSASDDAVVRRLMRVQNGTVTVPVDLSWKHLGVVAF